MSGNKVEIDLKILLKSMKNESKIKLMGNKNYFLNQNVAEKYEVNIS